MAWLWSKLTLGRRWSGTEASKARHGFPRHSWQELFDRLARAVEEPGGRVLIDRPAARIAHDGEPGLLVTAGAPDSFRRGHDPRGFEPAGQPERYEAVLASVPTDTFQNLPHPPLA